MTVFSFVLSVSLRKHWYRFCRDALDGMEPIETAPVAHEVIVIVDSGNRSGATGAGVDLRPLSVVIHEAEATEVRVLIPAHDNAGVVDPSGFAPVGPGKVEVHVSPVLVEEAMDGRCLPVDLVHSDDGSRVINTE